MRKRFEFGKIDYMGTGRKTHPVTVDVELRKCGGERTFAIDPKTKEKIYTGETTPEYTELSICGDIWNTQETDIVCGGQCLDTINEYKDQLTDRALFAELYILWNNYHLNGMHAGTPEQEKAIEEWKAKGNKYDYAKACEYLKEIGLYEVSYTGLSVGKRYNGEMYKYGQGWIVQELPAGVIVYIESLLNE